MHRLRTHNDYCTSNASGKGEVSEEMDKVRDSTYKGTATPINISCKMNLCRQMDVSGDKEEECERGVNYCISNNTVNVGNFRHCKYGKMAIAEN